MSHTIEDCKAAVEAWEDAQPVVLGCGCAQGTHENSLDGWQAAHPDIPDLHVTDTAWYFWVTNR